eukprot:6191118-Pleurochrysis_carterae.AAC.1
MTWYDNEEADAMGREPMDGIDRKPSIWSFARQNEERLRPKGTQHKRQPKEPGRKRPRELQKLKKESEAESRGLRGKKSIQVGRKKESK